MKKAADMDQEQKNKAFQKWSAFCQKCRKMNIEALHLAQPIDETFRKIAKRLLDIDVQEQKLFE